MLKDILSKYFEIYTDREILEKYSMDYSYLSSTLYNLKKIPEAIIKITTEEQIKTLLELSQEYNFYIIVRGSGTNTLGETVPIKENTIIADITNFKGFERIGDVLISRPGNDFNEIGINDIPVIPTSFYMSTLGGYAATGAYGFGALKNGALWDNLLEVEIYTPKGFYTVAGKNILSTTLAAGTTGIITKIKMRLVNRKYKKINIIKKTFNSLSKALDDAFDILNSAEFLSIRNYGMAKEIDPNYSWDKWNVIYGIYDENGQNYATKDIITSFAGSYFTVVSKRKVNYNSLNISLDELDKKSRILEEAKCLINAEITKSSNKIFSRTYILDYTKLPQLGYNVNLHSYKVNDIVKIDFTNKDRLEKIIDFKQKVDPEDKLNPGKINTNLN